MTIEKLPTLLSLASAVCLSLVGAQAHAETLTSEMAYRIVATAEDGTETLIERDSVRPGETLEFQIIHSNGTEEGIEGALDRAAEVDCVDLLLHLFEA